MAFGIGKFLKAVSPLAAFIPGVGTLAAASIAAGGSLLGDVLTKKQKPAGMAEMQGLAQALQDPNLGLRERIREAQGLALTPDMASASFAGRGFSRTASGRLGLLSSEQNRLGIGTNVARSQGNFALDNMRLSAGLYSSIAGLDMQQQAVRDFETSQGLGAAAWRLGLGLGQQADLGMGDGTTGQTMSAPHVTLPRFRRPGVIGPHNPFVRPPGVVELPPYVGTFPTTKLN